jgi:hypothetical protein
MEYALASVYAPGFCFERDAAGPFINVTGGDGAVTIADEGSEVGVVLRGQLLVCDSNETTRRGISKQATLSLDRLRFIPV